MPMTGECEEMRLGTVGMRKLPVTFMLINTPFVSMVVKILL